MSETAEWRETCAEADGLAVEIAMEPAADALDDAIGDVIASSILNANAVAGPARGVVTVRVDNDEGVRALNRVWRGIDKPTNVLSFS